MKSASLSRVERRSAGAASDRAARRTDSARRRPGILRKPTTRSHTALLLVDVINRLEFPGSRSLVRRSLTMSRPLQRLVARARRARIPVVYVNDNFGTWDSDWRKVLDACLAADSPGRAVVQRLVPQEGDYFVLKPKHSGFFCTTLDLLLRYLGARTLILTGIATDICILFTANDAYMRDYRLLVPSDCCAANTRDKHTHALRQIREVLKADIAPSARLDLAALRRRKAT
jgi:nicotinamidase-related amidase